VTFDEAFTKLLGHEGGYSNHPLDPGGETMWGVTLTVARANGYNGPMKDLPVGVAKSIYRKLYWDSVKADELPAQLRYAVFDAAVNSGVRQATLWLQRAVGVKDDGVIGPKTLEAAKMSNSYAANARMIGMRLDFMTRLNTWDSFGKGWARRIADLLK